MSPSPKEDRHKKEKKVNKEEKWKSKKKKKIYVGGPFRFYNEVKGKKKKSCRVSAVARFMRRKERFLRDFSPPVATF